MEKNMKQQHKGDASVYRIAGLNTAIAGADIMRGFGGDYLVEGKAHIDIVIDIAQDATEFRKSNPNVPWDTCCSIYAAGRQFYTHLLPLGGFALHASAVVLDGRAFLFSADSGTGKSTHTALWCQHFGKDRTYILNDDKPIIRKMDGQFVAFGAPWCGSSGLNKNASAPIAGIAFLEQAQSDWIRPAPPKDALRQLLWQADPTLKREGIGMLVSLFEDLIKDVPIYQLGCTISKNAVLTAYGTMMNKAEELSCISIA